MVDMAKEVLQCMRRYVSESSWNSLSEYEKSHILRSIVAYREVWDVVEPDLQPVWYERLKQAGMLPSDWLSEEDLDRVLEMADEVIENALAEVREKRIWGGGPGIAVAYAFARAHDHVAREIGVKEDFGVGHLALRRILWTAAYLKMADAYGISPESYPKWR